MSHAEKASYYHELKNAGVRLDKTYPQYTTVELKAAVELLRGAPVGVFEEAPVQTVAPPRPYVAPPRAAAAQAQTAPARVNRAPDTDAGLRLNAPEDVRVDEQGLVWYQDEVRKPAYPKARGRRVLSYVDPGAKKVTVLNGQYQETFEVAGDQQRQAEVKITLPSYQVGIYKDPRFPFKIHVYNDNRGFDLFEVQDFYGGAELVPAEIKRVYIENDLCYDIRTTVRAIQTEHRQQQLSKMKGI